MKIDTGASGSDTVAFVDDEKCRITVWVRAVTPVRGGGDESEPADLGGQRREVLRAEMEQIRRGVDLRVGPGREAVDRAIERSRSRRRHDRELVVEPARRSLEVVLRERRQHVAADVALVEEQDRVRSL